MRDPELPTKPTEEDYLDSTDRWHNSTTDDGQLCEWLGMTFREYAVKIMGCPPDDDDDPADCWDCGCLVAEHSRCGTCFHIRECACKGLHRRE